MAVRSFFLVRCRRGQNGMRPGIDMVTRPRRFPHSRELVLVIRRPVVTCRRGTPPHHWRCSIIRLAGSETACLPDSSRADNVSMEYKASTVPRRVPLASASPSSTGTTVRNRHKHSIAVVPGCKSRSFFVLFLALLSSCGLPLSAFRHFGASYRYRSGQVRTTSLPCPLLSESLAGVPKRPTFSFGLF